MACVHACIFPNLQKREMVPLTSRDTSLKIQMFHYWPSQKWNIYLYKTTTNNNSNDVAFYGASPHHQVGSKHFTKHKNFPNLGVHMNVMEVTSMKNMKLKAIFQTRSEDQSMLNHIDPESKAAKKLNHRAETTNMGMGRI